MLFQENNNCTPTHQTTSRFKMSCKQTTDCPICFEIITGEKNMIITECGHNFHASCLMRNVAHNGFNCPCCRFAMAEELQDDDSDVTSLVSDSSSEEEELYTDEALRGLRLFMNRLDGEENDQEDVVAEYEYPDFEPFIPTNDHVADMLMRENISYGDLTCALLADHEEYLNDNIMDTRATQIWNIIRRIINDHKQNGLLPEVDLDEDEEIASIQIEAAEEPLSRSASQQEPLEEGECVRDPCVPNGWALPLTKEERQAELDEICMDLNRYFSTCATLPTIRAK
jgi:hypothetical protein